MVNKRVSAIESRHHSSVLSAGQERCSMAAPAGSRKRLHDQSGRRNRTSRALPGGTAAAGETQRAIYWSIRVPARRGGGARIPALLRYVLWRQLAFNAVHLPGRSPVPSRSLLASPAPRRLCKACAGCRRTGLAWLHRYPVRAACRAVEQDAEAYQCCHDSGGIAELEHLNRSLAQLKSFAVDERSSQRSEVPVLESRLVQYSIYRWSELPASYPRKQIRGSVLEYQVRAGRYSLFSWGCT